jgi:serine/threonine-protein kinase RsbW
MVGLRSSPPPSAVAVQQWTLADATELQSLRASLRQAIDTQPLTPSGELNDVTERMVLAATELAANALLHARCPAVVRLSRTSKTFVLDVADEDPSFGARDTVERPLAQGGRGLRIVQDMAADAGWHVAGGRKHVWAQFAIPRRSRRWHAPLISVRGLDRFLRLFRRIGH